LLRIIQQELAKRCKKSKTRGRRATSAEVVLRMMLLKHVRDWSYEDPTREVRANLEVEAPGLKDPVLTSGIERLMLLHPDIAFAQLRWKLETIDAPSAQIQGMGLRALQRQGMSWHILASERHSHPGIGSIVIGVSGTAPGSGRVLFLLRNAHHDPRYWRSFALSGKQGRGLDIGRRLGSPPFGVTC